MREKSQSWDGWHVRIYRQNLIINLIYLLVAAYAAFVSALLFAQPTSAAVRSLSAGESHACAVTDYKIKCWGSNASGQLGNNSRTDSSAPVSPYTKAAYTETARICTGWEFFGNCLGGSWQDKKTDHPATPLYNRSVTKVSAGQYHTCALANAQAVCWGAGGSGQLGNNSNADSSVPVAVSTAGSLKNKEIIDIAAGDGFTCALASDGGVHCWGKNDNGQLGNGNRNGSNVSVAVSQGAGSAMQGKKIKKLAVLKGNTSTMCAIDQDDKAICWGQNYAGQAGNGRHAGDVDCQRLKPALSKDVDVLLPQSVALEKAKSITVSAKIDWVKQMEVGYTYVTALDGSDKISWWGGATSADTCGVGSNTNAQQENCHKAGGASQGGCGATEYERVYTYQGHCLEQEKVLLAPMNCTKRSPSGPVGGPLYKSDAANQLKDRTIAMVSGSPFTGSNIVENPLCTSTKTVNLLYTRAETSCPSTVPQGAACAVPTSDKNTVYCDDGSETCNTTGSVIGDNILKASGNWHCSKNGPQGVAIGGSSWLQSGMTITSIDTGFSGYTCAIADNNSVGCWGQGGRGQLGNGETRSSTVPVRVNI